MLGSGTLLSPCSVHQSKFYEQTQYQQRKGILPPRQELQSHVAKVMEIVVI